MTLSEIAKNKEAYINKYGATPKVVVVSAEAYGKILDELRLMSNDTTPIVNLRKLKYLDIEIINAAD